MKNIEKLFKKLNKIDLIHSKNQESIKTEIQKELNKIFNKNKEIKKSIKDLESGSCIDYLGEVDGIYSYIKCYELSEIKPEYREYLKNYLSDYGITIDFKNECLLNYLGDDNIIIQDDTRHDNGVWQGNKIIIAESEYKDDSREVDESLRNQLIEKHMEKTGYFPGVFRIDYYGNIFPINTKNEVNNEI
jgi:hypothetical protein